MLDQLISGLTKKERDIITLAIVYAYSVEDVAEVLNISKWAAYKRIKRGLRKMENILDIV